MVLFASFKNILTALRFGCQFLCMMGLGVCMGTVIKEFAVYREQIVALDYTACQSYFPV